MSPAVTLKDKIADIILSNHSSTEHLDRSLVRPSVLVATMDPVIRGGLAELLQAFSVHAIWSQGVETAKRMLARERISACVCGFWLQDGTYRELVRHIRRERLEIPVIIASAPACPDEYREYLEATNLGALNFLCFPYQRKDLETMLRLTLEPEQKSVQQRACSIGEAMHVGEAA